jgi:hypothetical protein
MHPAVSEEELKNESMLWHPGIPAFWNQESDCLRVAVLSAMHFFDARCPMGLRDLRQFMHGDRKVEGTGILEAAFNLLRLGLGVRVFAATTERMPENHVAIADKYNMIVRHPLSHPEAYAHVQKFHAVIHTLDPAALYPKASSSSHAVVLTGIGDRHVMYHESMRPPGRRSVGSPNMVAPVSCMDRAREAHDHHSLVIYGPLRTRDDYRMKVSRAVAQMRAERLKREQPQAG